MAANMVIKMVPSVHPKNYYRIPLVTKSNNILITFRQVELSHRPLGTEILGQYTCKWRPRSPQGTQVNHSI